MKINIHMEGGAGDHLLANRFVPAILEKYPAAEITAYSNSQGNTFQKEILDLGYSHLYKEVKVIQNKLQKEYPIVSQFGPENYHGCMENLTEEVIEEMVKGCDVFYDLHIDRLKWTNYDFDWLRYFYFFPRPKSVLLDSPLNLPKDYIITQLYPSTNSGHKLEDWYIQRILTKLAEKIHVVVIATPDINHIYEFAKGNPNITVLNTNIKTIFNVIENARLMLTCDSGFKYLAYGYNVPVLVYSAHSSQPHSSIPSHRIRWLLFPDQCFPLNYDSTYVIKCITNMLDEGGYSILPFVTNFNAQCIRRLWGGDLKTDRKTL